MKYRLFVLLTLVQLLSLLAPSAGLAQSPQTAGLEAALARATADTTRVLLLADISASYRFSRYDSVLSNAQRGLRLARRIGYLKGEGRCLSRLGILLSERGNLPDALRTDLDALQLNEQSHDLEGKARTLNQLGLLYQALEDYRPALRYFFQAKSIYEDRKIGDDSQLISVLANLGATYEGRGQLDSAAYFLNRAWELTAKSRTVDQSPWGDPAPYVLRELGLLEAVHGREESALRYYRRSAAAAIPEHDLRSGCRAYQYMAELYQDHHQTDSSIYYARKALAVGRALPFMIGVVRTSDLLADAFQAQGQHDSTLKYMHIMLMAQDSLYNPQRIKKLDAIGFAEQQRLRQLQEEQATFEAKVRMGILLAGLGVLVLIALLLYRTIRLQRSANRKLHTLNEQVTQQKEELRVQRDRLAQMLQELKAAQSQLVLREKMASLGELMAGVAHEIQDPMQAIRNFAGISEGLCQELREEMTKGVFDTDDQEILDEMLQNLIQYQAKIEQHSQRADSIVRSMVEYSGTGPGPRQHTDLNTLADDYLRLAHHNLRIKHRHFDAALEPKLDPTLGPIEVPRQELGRALLHLFTNALIAVQQRSLLGEEDYTPQVTVTTRRQDRHVEIRVLDNGIGIAPEAQASLFQRFFTSDATAEGTSLGLSESHDIVTNSLGGKLTVTSKAGQYTEFVITLPLTAEVDTVAAAG
ncbi:tetratricopeptide repeat protein [Hymenobacter sp. BT175]|uniref:tetratricopeptide repeat-containing sensor histidine kinase n=1 Tax=Hymenobacter translucens TaxID=2886507 RepID=UPI001D0E2860|nr:ATP-binding protein [Hymenobacter translucens]MCC2547837.1 tetratricopeptide repeat protein [Hymenobacter translucens]